MENPILLLALVFILDHEIHCKFSNLNLLLIASLCHICHTVRSLFKFLLIVSSGYIINLNETLTPNLLSLKKCFIQRWNHLSDICSIYQARLPLKMVGKEDTWISPEMIIYISRIQSLCYRVIQVWYKLVPGDFCVLFWPSLK